MGDELQRITEIIRDIFDEYEGPVTRRLSATDVSQWDSLGHVQFVVMVEQAFGVRFTTHEVGNFRNIGELLDAIGRKRTREV